MRVQRHATAADFLAEAGPFLLAAEVENNLTLGIVRSVASGAAPADPSLYLATVHNADAVCMAAFRYRSNKVAITRATRDDAIAHLAQDANDACAEATEVIGPEPTVKSFASALAALREAKAERRMAQRVYELRAIDRHGVTTSGRLRRAGPSDTGLLTEWASGFLADTDNPGDPAKVVAERIARNQLFVWEDGEVVSMAAWTGKTPNGVRINFVYTPPAKRQRGYATACVAALSQLMLDHGNLYCCLYTDLANPTSNGIYQQIGYRPVGDTGVYTIAP